MVSKTTKPGSTTRRPTVQALENLLHEPIKVLDHGFIRVVDYMGDDKAIVDAARVSYGRGTKTASEDRALIHYLMRHQHTPQRRSGEPRPLSKWAWDDRRF